MALPKSALDHMAREQRAGADVHPDADVLTAFCEGVLADVERNRVMSHIARCGSCREVVFLAAPEALSQPALAQQHGTQTVVKPAASWWRRYMPVMAAAAAVVVVGSAVLLNPNLTKSRVGHESEAVKTEAPPAVPANQADETKVAKAVTPESSLAKQDVPAESVKNEEVNKKVFAPAVGGMIADKEVDLRGRDAAVNSTVQQQTIVTAAGPHGPVEPKGNLSNYQNVAVTPPARSIRVAPSAHGELEAKGNAYYYENAAPIPSKPQTSVSGVAASAPAKSAGLKEEAATRSDASNVVASERNAPPPVAAQKAKLADKKAPAPAATDQLAKTRPEIIAGTKDTSSFSSDVGTDYQEPMGAVMPPDRYHWKIDDQGGLHKSSGADDWKPELAKTNTKFNVVSVVGNEVWAGGSAGNLFRSIDGGAHWSRVEIKVNGRPLSEAIMSIKFRNAQSGTITTESGSVLETNDGGVHWKRKQ